MDVGVFLKINQIFIRGIQKNSIQKIADRDITIPKYIKHLKTNKKFIILKFLEGTLKLSRYGNLDFFLNSAAISTDFRWNYFFCNLKNLLLVLLQNTDKYQLFHFNFVLCNIHISGKVALEKDQLFSSILTTFESSQNISVELGCLDSGIFTPVTATLNNIKNCQILYLKRHPSTAIRFYRSGKFSGVLKDYNTFQEFLTLIQTLKQ